MEITLEKKDKVNAALRINLLEADYKPKYTNKLKEYGKKVQLKGFRPGHVPVALVEKMYGKSILVEEINQIISDQINNYLKENKIEILGDPMPEAKEMASINWDAQKDFNFTYNLGLVPDFNLDLSAKTSVEKFNITFDDKIVKETIENLRKQYGTYTDVEVVTDEDIIYADAKDTATGKDYKCILPEFRIVESERKLFAGAKIGEKITSDIRKLLGEDASIAYVLGIDKKEAEFISGVFEFVITRISHASNADLNEEFYNKIFRGADIKTYEDFEAKVKENVGTNYVIESKNALYNDVYKYLTENTKIELPVDFLKNWLTVVNEGKISKEELEAQFPDFEKGLIWDLIKNKVAKDGEIKVEHEDVMQKAVSLVKSQFGMADNQLDGEMLKMVEQLADNVLKRDNGKEYRRYFDEAYAEKALDYIISKMNIKEKSIDIESFKKLRS